MSLVTTSHGVEQFGHFLIHAFVKLSVLYVNKFQQCSSLQAPGCCRKMTYPFVFAANANPMFQGSSNRAASLREHLKSIHSRGLDSPALPDAIRRQ